MGAELPPNLQSAKSYKCSSLLQLGISSMKARYYRKPSHIAASRTQQLSSHSSAPMPSDSPVEAVLESHPQPSMQRATTRGEKQGVSRADAAVHCAACDAFSSMPPSTMDHHIVLLFFRVATTRHSIGQCVCVCERIETLAFI